MLPKLDPSEIEVVYVRYTGGGIGVISALAPQVCPLGLSLEKVGDAITKATGVWKGLRIRVKLAVQNRQAHIIPSASALIIRALREALRDRKKQKTLRTVEIPLLMSLSTSPNRCSTNL